jgi:hypothetical protein
LTALRLARRDALVLGLALFLPAAVQIVSGPLPELGPDATEYFSQLRSLYFDHDVQLENEFAHYGLLERYDKGLTSTGYRRTLYAVGPALYWLPFYAAADLWSAATGGARDGYGGVYLRAVALGSLAWVVLGALLVHRVLSGLVTRAAAAVTAVLVVYATSLYWYAVHAPAMSHAASFFAGAALLAVWWDGRHGLSPRRALALGVLAGLAASVRWQNLLLLLLPATTLAYQVRTRARTALLCGLLAAAGALAGALPQMLAWKAIWGSYLLTAMPQGNDYVRLSRPYLLESFFSSRHGLLYWTPVLWGGVLGLLPLVRRDARAAAAMLLPLACMTWVNASVLDWWAAGSFSNRRFDSVLPFLAVGLGLALEALRAAAARRPGGVLAALGLALTAWNFLFMQQYKQNRIPRDDTVSFPRVAGNSATLLSELAGSPLAWPANWIWAARHDTSPAFYDLMVGKYLFYRQASLQGVIDLGDEAGEALLADGWAAHVRCEDQVCRLVRGRARLFAPLDLPETLDLRVRACGEGALALTLEGRRLAEWPLGAALEDLRVRIPAHYWRAGHNDLRLEVGSGGWAAVDRVQFVRVLAAAP